MDNHDVEKELELTNPDSIEVIQENSIPAEAVLPEIMAKVQAEIERGYREAKYKDKTYRIYFPSVGDEEEISINYSRGYSLLLQAEGVISNAELERIYAAKNMWTKADDERIVELRETVDEFKEDITALMIKDNEENKQENKEEAVRIYAKQAETIDELRQLNVKKAELFNPSLENLAREIAIRSKLACCAKDENGVRIWDDLAELNKEEDTLFASTVLKTALYFWQGIPEDFLEESPENQSGE